VSKTLIQIKRSNRDQHCQDRAKRRANIVVAPTSEKSSATTESKSNENNKNDVYDINEIRRKLSATESSTKSQKTQEKAKKDDNSLETLVRELFDPYGDIEYFYFDYQNGAGVVQYKNGKSGESCYLMSHLLPFTVTTTNSASTSSPLSFSLICLEFACLLPFSPKSRSLFSSSSSSSPSVINNWMMSRKRLDQLTANNNNDDDLIQDSNWRNHLQFMESQRSKTKLYFKNLSWLRHELMVVNNNENQESQSLSAKAASELQSHIEQHLATLLFSKSGNDCDESSLFDALLASDFWNQILLPSCLDKIVSTLCEIDIDKVGIALSSSPTKKNKNATSENNIHDDDENKIEKSSENRTKLMISMIHSSISILDVWLALYHTFYCGEFARKEHSSIVAVLESKLIQSSSNENNNNNKNSESNSAYSLRHPAWPSFAVSHLSEESRLQAINKNGYSPALNRRIDFIKLFSGGVLPINLGLKQWPGGAHDDVGSAFRAVLAMLVAVRPLYLDQSFRHMWTSLFIDENSSFLSQLHKNDAKIKKQFLAVSSKQESLIEGAWNILYRAGWKMETAFSLIISYLNSEHKNSVESTSSSSENQDFIQQLKSLDSQPPLWNLLRPIDKLENDWNLGRGVLTDEAMVYRRLFDGDEEFAKIKKEHEENDQQKGVKNNGFLWTSVIEPVLSFVLLYGLGQNPAVLYSRYYRRKFINSILSFGPPLVAMLMLGLAIFFFLKFGYGAVVAERLHEFSMSSRLLDFSFFLEQQ
jgi:hypothetical protein